jgi:ATP adenylyltransferase
MAYVTGQDQPVADMNTPTGCPFCRAPKRSAAQGLVVAKGASVYAVLNLYPYNPGHLMICPYRHVADYTDLDPDETVELAEFTQTAMNVVRKVSGPAGFNIGMNQGHVAGAGIAAHLHQHIVPRWAGDTNFMPVVAHTKVLPQLLADTRALLAQAWQRARRVEAGRTAAARTAAATRTAATARTAAAARTPATARTAATAASTAATARNGRPARVGTRAGSRARAQ